MDHTALSTEEPVFVCGIPKSGTTMVGHLLSHHTDLQTNYDIDPASMFLRYVRETMQDHFFFAEDFRTGPIGEENRYWSDNDNREWHLINLAYFRDMHISYRNGARHWGSSSCYTYVYRSLIWKWFPKAIMLMLMRDPRDNWCSFKHLHINHVKDENTQWERFVTHYNKFPARDTDPRMKFVEYHDVVLNPTIVFDILGLSVPENYLNDMMRIFIDRTRGDEDYDPTLGLREGSPMVKSRIGRWKCDLSTEEIRKCTEAFPEACEYYDSLKL